MTSVAAIGVNPKLATAAGSASLGNSATPIRLAAASESTASSDSVMPIRSATEVITLGNSATPLQLATPITSVATLGVNPQSALVAKSRASEHRGMNAVDCTTQLRRTVGSVASGHGESDPSDSTISIQSVSTTEYDLDSGDPTAPRDKTAKSTKEVATLGSIFHSASGNGKHFADLTLTGRSTSRSENTEEFVALLEESTLVTKAFERNMNLDDSTFGGTVIAGSITSAHPEDCKTPFESAVVAGSITSECHRALLESTIRSTITVGKMNSEHCRKMPGNDLKVNETHGRTAISGSTNSNLPERTADGGSISNSTNAETLDRSSNLQTVDGSSISVPLDHMTFGPTEIDIRSVTSKPRHSKRAAFSLMISNGNAEDDTKKMIQKSAITMLGSIISEERIPASTAVIENKLLNVKRRLQMSPTKSRKAKTTSTSTMSPAKDRINTLTGNRIDKTISAIAASTSSAKDEEADTEKTEARLSAATGSKNFLKYRVQTGSSKFKSRSTNSRKDVGSNNRRKSTPVSKNTAFTIASEQSNNDVLTVNAFGRNTIPVRVHGKPISAIKVVAAFAISPTAVLRSTNRHEATDPSDTLRKRPITTVTSNNTTNMQSLRSKDRDEANTLILLQSTQAPITSHDTLMRSTENAEDASQGSTNSLKRSSHTGNDAKTNKRPKITTEELEVGITNSEIMVDASKKNAEESESTVNDIPPTDVTDLQGNIIVLDTPDLRSDSVLPILVF